MIFDRQKQTAGGIRRIGRGAVIAALALVLLAAGAALAEGVEMPVILLPEEGEFFNPEMTADNTWPDVRPDGVSYGYSDDYWSGCSVWCAVAGSEEGVTSSSTLEDQGDYTYGPGNLIDGSRNTAWVEGMDGYGESESVTLEETIHLSVEENTLTYTGLCIVNGYARTEETWRQNSRVKRLIVYKDGQYLCDLLLRDSIKPQFFDLSDLGITAASGEPVYFRFLIADVWPGEMYTDTALTGIEFSFQTPNH